MTERQFRRIEELLTSIFGELKNENIKGNTKETQRVVGTSEETGSRKVRRMRQSNETASTSPDQP